MAKFVHGRTMLGKKKKTSDGGVWLDWIVFNRQGEPLDQI